MPALTANQLTALTAQYNAIKDFPARRAFYHDTLFPALRDYFAAQDAAEPPIEVLLLPVSNQYVPVLAAARWKPKVAFPIYSSRSVEHRQFIEDQIAALGLDIMCTGQEVLNIEIAPEELYKAIKLAIAPYLRSDKINQHVAVDITGGTSVMSVGAAMAVSLIGGRFFYILSGAAKDDITQREVGTEQPRPLEDPYIIFGDLQRDRARAFFAEHDYVTAEQLFSELAQRVAPSQGDAFWADLAHAYVLWESFDLAATDRALQDMLTFHAALAPDQQNLIEAHLDAICRVRPLVEQHGPQRDDPTTWQGERSFGGAIRRFVPGQIRRLTTDHVAPTLLAMLYTNALRRAEQERLDTAALLLYRCLELMSQQRLARSGVLTEFARDGLEQLRRRIPQLEQRCTAVLQTVRADGRMDLPYYKSKVALFEGYVLLQAIEDPFGQRCDLAQIEEQTATRNQSILAHGFSFISHSAYTSFKATVDTVIDHWCAEEELIWTEYRALCTFAIPQDSEAD